MASPIVDRSQLQVLLGSYAVGKSQALTDPFLSIKAQGYRRQLSSRMMALDKNMAKERLPASDCFVSRKVDGECTILLIDAGDCCSVNPGGVVRSGLPFMNEAVELLAKTKFKQVLLAGELFVSRTDRRPRVHDVSRVARQPASQEDLDALHFAVFDIIEIDGKSAPESYAAVHKQMDAIFKNGQRIRAVDTVRTTKIEDVFKAFETWVETEGGEGIVVRSDSAGLFKIKPRFSVDAAVLGFTEGTSDRTGMLHDLLLGLMRKDETFHILGRVGGGFSDEQRQDWLSDLKDMTAESDYAEINDSVAYQMVRPEWVVEISVLDLINQNSRGGSVDRMVLEYRQTGNAYRSIRRLPLASPISPVFVRRREDKSIRADDLRMQQVGDIIEIPMIDHDVRKLERARSEVLRREVFTKTLKGALMVRKLMLWKTNKCVENGNYPEFVAYFTDFSPNRATPLDRDIRISNSREQIEALYDELKAENIVKGWAPAEIA